MKQQKLLKTIVLALLALGGVSAWADGVNLLTQDGVTATGTTNCSASISDGKLTVTPTTTGEFRVTISGTFSIPTDKTFFVVEMDNTDFQTANQNLRNIKIGETTHDATGNVANFDIDTKKVCIYSSLMAYSNNLAGAYQGNTSLTVNGVDLNFKANATTARVIYSAGFYNLADILNKYEALRTSKDWQYVTVANLRIESNGTGGNTIKIKDTTGGTATIAQIKLFIKSLGLSDLPAAYTNLTFGNLQPSDATTEDLFTGVGTRKLYLSHVYMHKMPTLCTNLYDSNSNALYRFLDGTNPSTVTASGTGGNWAIYTRSLKAGYNSCMLPFRKMAGADYVQSGVEFYKVDSYSSKKASFANVSDTYTNNTFITVSGNANVYNPFIIYAPEDGLYTFVGRDAITTSSEYTGYKEKRFGSTNLYFVGTFENECPMASGKAYENYTCYGIASNGTSVKKMNSTTTASYYRAFIVDKSVSPARELSISFDNGDGTTDIVSLKDVHGLGVINDGTVYNLQGVQMQSDNLPRGIYVKNGKKFIVK